MSVWDNEEGNSQTATGKSATSFRLLKNRPFILALCIVCALLGVGLIKLLFSYAEQSYQEQQAAYRASMLPYTEAQICRAGFATLELLKAKDVHLQGHYEEGGVIRMGFHYKDGRPQRARCRLDGFRIQYGYGWDYGDGRWRDDPRDEKLSWEVGNGVLLVRYQLNEYQKLRNFRPSDF